MMNPDVFPGISQWEAWKDKKDIDQLPEYLDCILFRFPDISDLTYEQLSYTRENILKKIKNFNEQIHDLREACFEMFYEPKHWETLQRTINEKLNGAEQLQQFVDEEIHIQQARNSGSKKIIEVSMGITSMESLANYYEKSGMLKPYVAAILKERIDKATGLSRSIIYYNIRVGEYI
jgi:hypothetical protein